MDRRVSILALNSEIVGLGAIPERRT